MSWWLIYVDDACLVAKNEDMLGVVMSVFVGVCGREKFGVNFGVCGDR